MNDKKILIVDDEKPIVDILKFNLEKEGFVTTVAYDGEEAISMAIAVKPDLILLDLASFFGLVTTLFAFVYLIFIIIKYTLFGDPVQGWPTLICVILLMGGMQLFALGIIGQYIGKTYMEVKNRPHYIISETNKKEIIRIK